MADDEWISEEEQENLPLENEWAFWFDKGQKNRTGGGKDSYLSRLKNMGSFGTVMDFWKHFNGLRVSEMKSGSNLMLFKHGIDPVWEHPRNTRYFRSPRIVRSCVSSTQGAH